MSLMQARTCHVIISYMHMYFTEVSALFSGCLTTTSATLVGSSGCIMYHAPIEVSSPSQTAASVPPGGSNSKEGKGSMCLLILVTM